jgi:nitrogen fixation protein FixH
MHSQTARRPQNQRTPRPHKSNKARRYAKQTAHFEGKRDGKPLLFGWGGHLSHNQKIQFQRRATWAAASAFGLLIVIVLVGFWININVIIPGLAITSVNGHQIPQSLYRKMVAFNAQSTQNQLNGPNGLIAQQSSLRTQIVNQQKTMTATQTQIETLTKQIKALPAGASAQRTLLNKELDTINAQLAAENVKE